MWIGKIFRAIVSLVIGLALLQTSQGQDSQQDFLNAHNQARASVAVPPLIWDNKLVAYAQNRVNQMKRSCKFTGKDGPYGENLVQGRGDLSGTAAVQIWVNQRLNYDYSSKFCIGGRECKGYTNVVWSNTVRLGCAKVRCNNGGTIIGCNYDPRGNIIGERPFSLDNLLVDFLSKRNGGNSLESSVRPHFL